MNKKTILMERLDKYCKQLGCSTPKIIWTKSDFMKVINETPSLKQRGLASKNTLGRCCREEGLVYIAYQKLVKLRDLDHTIRHELVHWRFPQVKHGARFEKLIIQIKDGVCWEPFTDADFEAYRQKRIRKLTMNRLFPKNRITPSEDPFATKEDTLIYTEGGSNNNV